MYWQHYTREQAAQDLLNVSNRLSHRSHVFRPIDPVIKLQAIEKLTRTSEKLSQIGYTVGQLELTNEFARMLRSKTLPPRDCRTTLQLYRR